MYDIKKVGLIHVKVQKKTAYIKKLKAGKYARGRATGEQNLSTIKGGSLSLGPCQGRK